MIALDNFQLVISGVSVMKVTLPSCISSRRHLAHAALTSHGMPENAPQAETLVLGSIDETTRAGSIRRQEY